MALSSSKWTEPPKLVLSSSSKKTNITCGSSSQGANRRRSHSPAIICSRRQTSLMSGRLCEPSTGSTGVQVLLLDCLFLTMVWHVLLRPFATERISVERLYKVRATKKRSRECAGWALLAERILTLLGLNRSKFAHMYHICIIWYD